MVNFIKNKHNTETPKDFNWEIHNLHAYAQKKKAFAEGRITLTQLQEFEHQYRESAEQRDERWRREHVLKEISEETGGSYVLCDITKKEEIDLNKDTKVTNIKISNS